MAKQGAPAKHEHADGKCPLHAVDRRLEDCHRHWHEAERAYFDPEGFRVAIQTAIQTLRTVTFILQSNKRLIPDFAGWYAGWQERLAADPLMRWMVDARNKIEKQGDLEAHSFVRAEIVASHLKEGAAIEVPAELSQSVGVLLKSIPDSALGEHIRKHGVLRIERRWVENTLPDHELLDAVATAYGMISQLLDDAHRQMGLPPPTTTNVTSGEEYGKARSGRLPCMVGHAERRTLDVSLDTGGTLTPVEKEVPFDLKDAQKAAKRYGLPMEGILGKSEDVEQELHNIFKTARVMTEKDGHHVTALFLYRAGKVVRIVQVAPENVADKYLLMRRLAHEAARLPADAVIMIGEIWSAKADPSRPYMRAADAPDREEFLVATLVRKEGEPVSLMAKFKRGRFAKRKVTLEETVESRDGAYFQFAPLYEVWGRAIPQEWLEVGKAAVGVRDNDRDGKAKDG